MSLLWFSVLRERQAPLVRIASREMRSEDQIEARLTANRMQRTPRLRLGSNPNVSGAGSLIRDVRQDREGPISGDLEQNEANEGTRDSLFSSFPSVRFRGDF